MAYVYTKQEAVLQQTMTTLELQKLLTTLTWLEKIKILNVNSMYSVRFTVKEPSRYSHLCDGTLCAWNTKTAQELE